MIQNASSHDTRNDQNATQNSARDLNDGPKHDAWSGHKQAHKGAINGKVALIIGILLLVGLFAFGYIPRMRQKSALADEAKKEKNALPQVVITKPKPAPDSDLTLPGNTQAIEDAVIAARTTGYLRKRYVDIGAHVKQGQLLAEIEAPDVEAQAAQARQQVGQAVATVRQSESDVTNRQATVAQTQSNVKQTEANLEQARAQSADAEAKLSQAEAQLSTTQAQLLQTQQTVDIKRSVLNQTQTQLNLAAVTLKRYQTLLKSGFVALQDVDQSQANYDTALAAVKSAEADVRGAEANVKASQDQVQSARANVKSFQAGVTASQKNIKAVAATVNSAGSAVAAARANVRSSRAVVDANRANVRAAQANEQRYSVQSGFSRVVAPFAGVITARNVDVGTLINAGSGGGGTASASGGGQNSASTSSATPSTTPTGGLFGIARTDILRVQVGVPQAYASLMKKGVKAQLLLREFPGREFTGEVHNVSGAIDTVSRTLLTEIYVPNQNGTLLAGMYAHVHFDLPKTEGSLRIPASALVYDAKGTRAITVTPENKIHIVPITVGRDYGAEIEVTQGLTTKDNVVTNPTDDLAEDLVVTSKQAPPPPPASGAAPGGQPGAPPNSNKPPVSKG